MFSAANDDLITGKEHSQLSTTTQLDQIYHNLSKKKAQPSSHERLGITVSKFKPDIINEDSITLRSPKEKVPTSLQRTMSIIG